MPGAAADGACLQAVANLGSCLAEVAHLGVQRLERRARLLQSHLHVPHLRLRLTLEVSWVKSLCSLCMLTVMASKRPEHRMSHHAMQIHAHRELKCMDAHKLGACAHTVWLPCYLTIHTIVILSHGL